MPVNAPLRFLPRGVGGTASAEGPSSVSMCSACAKLSRESCDCVSAVGVSGMSSSSEMGEGMRRLRSSDGSCRVLGLRDGGAWDVGAGRPLLVLRLPAEPLEGKPRPFNPPRLKVGCIGVGIRPLVVLGSALKSEALSMAGRMRKLLVYGDCGWLRTSRSSSSMSMSWSCCCESCIGPSYGGFGESASS